MITGYLPQHYNFERKASAANGPDPLMRTKARRRNRL